MVTTTSLLPMVSGVTAPGGWVRTAAVVRPVERPVCLHRRHVVCPPAARRAVPVVPASPPDPPQWPL